MDRALLAVRAPTGLFAPSFLAKLAALHEDLEAHVPFTGKVTSLLNVRSTRGAGDRLVVEALFEEWPRSEEGWAELERRARANPLYQDLFVSRDGRWTLLVVEPDPYAAVAAAQPALDVTAGFDDEPASDVLPVLSTAHYREIHDAVQAVADRHRGGLEILVGGPLPMGAIIAGGIERDFGVLLGAATAVIGGLLLLVFRRLSSAVLALLVVLLSLASAIGLMAWLGIPLDIGTQVLPSFLLAVGIGYAVHVLTIFSQRFRENGDKPAAIAGALEHTGLPIVMTGLTTMAGLLAVAFTYLVPLERIGVFAPLGVLMAVTSSLVLLPALLAVLPIAPATPQALPRIAERALVRLGDFSVAHRRSILGGLALVLLLSVGGIQRVGFSHNPLLWVDEDSEFRRANAVLEEQFGGAFEIDLLVRAREEGGLRRPELLRALDSLEARLLALETRGIAAAKVIGLHGVVKEIHQALHEDDPAFYAVPEEVDVVAQELLLFENSGTDDLEEVTDTRFGLGRVSVRVNFADGYALVPYGDLVDRTAKEALGTLADAELTGFFALSVRTFSALNESLVRSYAIAMIVIGALMLLLIGRVREGLAAAIPNLAPIFVTVGIMGYAGLPFSIFTLLVANIALGLAVDDTIHFVHNYLRDREDGGDPVGAVRRTLASTGSALLFTTVALLCGFSLFAFASLENLAAFGLLAALAIGLAFVADVLVAPGLMVIVDETRRGRLDDRGPEAGATVPPEPLGAGRALEGPTG